MMVTRLCHAALDGHQPLLASLFMAGLVGGATHCSGMCGPFVLAQTAARMDHLPLQQATVLQRAKGALLAPYHAGRMTTYAVLGALASLLVMPLRQVAWFQSLSSVLLVGAALLFLAAAFRVMPSSRFFSGLRLPLPEKWVRALSANPVGWRGYVLGVLLGFLPCGMVYAALVASSASGNPVTAGFAMVIFSLGTIPALIAVGIGGQFVLNRYRPVTQVLASMLMIMNSFVLFAMAGGYI